MNTRITLRQVREAAKLGRAIAMLTCYDAMMARWLVRGGVEHLLVGDTAAQMLLGYESTVFARMEVMVELTAAVRRGAPSAFIMADMPMGSYHTGKEDAVRNALLFMQQGGADVVKLEVTAEDDGLVERLTRAGVPVVAHVGSRPQQVMVQGGYKSAGRTASDAKKIVDTAKLMIACGAVMLLVEAVPSEVSRSIVKVAEAAEPVVPVIGCGAGAACHGHVVVTHDLLGLTDWQPAFAKPIAQVGHRLAAAAQEWKRVIEAGEYLKQDHPYRMVGDAKKRIVKKSQKSKVRQ